MDHVQTESGVMGFVLRANLAKMENQFSLAFIYHLKMKVSLEIFS